MGFMDKLKAAKNSLTGDWADVSIDVEPAARGESLTVTATVTVKGEPISTEGIVVELVCQEEIDIPSATVHEPGSLTSSSQGSRRATSSAAVFETEVKAADPQELAAGSVTTATATVPIPMSAPPTMQGRYARYEWRVRARVEMKGNDPDSGWTDIAVG